MFLGILLLLLGVLMLLSKLNIIHGDFWQFFWPIALIALGISIVLRHTKRP
jgi:uncharacterized membrane protein HdeD (DUF308 family)